MMQPGKIKLDRNAVLARGRAVLQAEGRAIAAAEQQLGDSFLAAVQAVLECKGRICVTGMGKARIIGEKIQATLASTGTLSYPLHPVEAMHGDLGMVHSEDVVIGLSRSGSTELAQVLPILRQQGCKIILLTASLQSKAARVADIVLDIGSVEEACPLGLAPSSSTVAMLALGDAIALTVMDQRSVCKEEYASYHPGGALGRSLMRASEIMRKGADCPRVHPESLVSECYEAILKAPRRAGAAMAVDPEGRLVGIVTQGDFFRFIQEKRPAGDATVAGLMTSDPKCVGQDELLPAVLDLMRRHSIDELPVVDDAGVLVGLIDVQDLIASGFSVFDQV